ncbi:MAG: 3,4-dihydroxy-2-butanone-4-phosphate synthase [Solirubrobacteraceae bacterium]|nr:3,4-dihydroxy-2-butanone-4-phosphate synthase [Solirubrobacteraceae bacterium]
MDRTDANVRRAVAAIGRGEMIVLVDDEDRENEGDVVMAAELATTTAVNFMATHARGLICAAMDGARLAALGIPPMTERNEDPLGTAFHVSVDHHTRTTGISAVERARTIRALADPRSVSGDFTRPGHVFPLAARDGGVLERDGHTEASVELCRMAGLTGAAVICEVMRPDGEMARYPDLVPFAERHGMVLATIADLVDHRRRHATVDRREPVGATVGGA